MVSPLRRSFWLLAIVVGLFGLIPGSVAAQGAGAKEIVEREAPMVWVNPRSGVYHCPGTRYYGNTKSGVFMAEAAAQTAGNRPAYGRTCGPISSTASSMSPPRLGATAKAGAAESQTKVWVNTRSGVYHCPGTRYYGNTKAGQFMTEANAKNEGHRPAYGRPCS